MHALTLNHYSSSKHYHHHYFSTKPRSSKFPHTSSWHHSGFGRTCSVSLWSARSFSKHHVHFLWESRKLQPHLPSRPCGRYPPGEVVPIFMHTRPPCLVSFFSLFPWSRTCTFNSAYTWDGGAESSTRFKQYTRSLLNRFLCLPCLSPQALSGSCATEGGELVAVWTLKGTSYSDNGTRVICQRSNSPDTLAAILHVYGKTSNCNIA